MLGVGYAAYNLYQSDKSDAFPQLEGIYGGEITINQKVHQLMVDAEVENIYRVIIFDIANKVQDLKFENRSYLTIKIDNDRYSLIGDCFGDKCSGSVLKSNGIEGSWSITRSNEKEITKLNLESVGEWQKLVDQLRISEQELADKRDKISELQNDYEDYQEIVSSGQNLKEASQTKAQEYELQINQAALLIEAKQKSIFSLSDQLQSKMKFSKAGVLLNKSQEFLEYQNDTETTEVELASPMPSPAQGISATNPDFEEAEVIKPVPAKPTRDITEEQP